MVFVSSAAKVANRDLKSGEEAELELLCSAVDEESFGTAMVDCVLRTGALWIVDMCCLTAGLPFDSKSGPVRQQLQQKLVKPRSGGCLERSGDRKFTVWVTIATTVTSSQMPNVGNFEVLDPSVTPYHLT